MTIKEQQEGVEVSMKSYENMKNSEDEFNVMFLFFFIIAMYVEIYC